MSSQADADNLRKVASHPASRRWKLIVAGVAGVIVIAAVVVIAVSSGSSAPSTGSSSSPGGSLNSYITKADAICSSMSPQIYSAIQNVSTAEGQNSSPAVRSAVSALSQLGHREVAQLEALPQPSEDAGLVKRFYNADTHAVTGLLAAIAPGASATVELQATQDVNSVHQLAIQIGFTSCSQTQNVPQR